jgi:hypothetical protein
VLGWMAGAEGLELSTSGFGDRRSSQLSYAPILTSTKPAFHTLREFVSSVWGFAGAGDGNRTRTTSLEGWDSTVELHPRYAAMVRA